MFPACLLGFEGIKQGNSEGRAPALAWPRVNGAAHAHGAQDQQVLALTRPTTHSVVAYGRLEKWIACEFTHKSFLTNPNPHAGFHAPRLARCLLRIEQVPSPASALADQVLKT